MMRLGQPSASVVALQRYPVKSMMGEPLNTVEVNEVGLLCDRAHAYAHRSRSCRTAHPVRLAVVPSSTQFLPLHRTESMSSRPFNWRVFQQNRPIGDIDH
jgi:uncharacterized protein YcbX